MSSVLQDWRRGLIEAHSDLFRPPVGVPEGAEGCPECGPGWRDLIDRCCIRIRAAVATEDGTFKFTQIRRSTRAFACTGPVASLRKRPPASRRRSTWPRPAAPALCEICGEAGVLRTGGWLTTRCDLHAEGRAPAEVRPGFENIHIVRYGLGAQRRITCRRYDRENDAFVDVDPATLGIAED
ncbi:MULTISPECIES: hypothetical protein [unclassified Bradyrhizobium]|uniref:hypothetical protein n=1 Tax=unclassified Bradyrhizobium TaxID=2631580 RepID=UPI001FF77A1A|nr:MULTISPECIES: hypothetical protein [unclassified Bradyrhizobium]